MHSLGTKGSRVGRAGHWCAVDRVASTRSKTSVGRYALLSLMKECLVAQSVRTSAVKEVDD